MKLRILIILLILPVTLPSPGQQETYSVTLAPFSSDKYDEFSPVWYGNGLVFTTTRKAGSLINYSSSFGNPTVNINYIDTTGTMSWRKARVFSKSLRTPFNDGPVTFNATGDTIYFSRNLYVDGSLSVLSSPRNRLGIFMAVLEGTTWTKITEFRFNNEWYNITTPWLAPDGSRLYFASDKPDGYGGSDLYYCEWKGGYWTDPVNLGPVINTSGNESYPFVNAAGELLFSSDGHPGIGGKDIFFSRPQGNQWLPPVRLDPPVNTEYDDFGIVTDSLFSNGYFSSNRDGSIDIFHFKTIFPQIFYTDIQRENQYCFIFSDQGGIEADTMNLRYRWDFGDGQTAYGPVVQHCFSGPGDYLVKLDIIDRSTGNLFFTKLVNRIELRDYEQPFIKSPDVAVTGESIQFDAINSFLPGYEILTYSWEFGEGTRLQGERVSHTFISSGYYDVNLGVTLRSKSTGVVHKTGVSKKIVVLRSIPERASWLAKKSSTKPTFPDIREYENAHVITQYSAEEQAKKEAYFTIELYSSKTRADMNSPMLKNLPVKYNVREVYDSVSRIYSYTAEDFMNLMDAWPSFRELTGIGFKDAQVKINVISDAAERELYNTKKNYGLQSDGYFDAYNRLRAGAYLLLDQVVILMNRNPEAILEIGAHTDHTGTAANNLQISQARAQVMVNYLVNRGINAKRLIPRGYGGTKPIASNILDAGRRLNRRVDFRIITK